MVTACMKSNVAQGSTIGLNSLHFSFYIFFTFCPLHFIRIFLPPPTFNQDIIFHSFSYKEPNP
ncbi:hypothetical protein MtrunA17_Chr4g0064191 [Medicago truncatula]|uniref:Transmembrane protein n=1 Tax=Medicago truncatula TaxID=3880 RepID=A0A396IEH2_MEDTR|nr:hypothetical protein MtrunA17_Chr4g0064191 [Medicago truncatula]